MPPPIFTDAYIKKMCPENHPIPLAKLSVMAPTKPPAYLAKGYTGIKYVPPPHRPPRTIHTLAKMMAGTNEAGLVRAQEDIIKGYVNAAAPVNAAPQQAVNVNMEDESKEETGQEETKAEVDVDLTGSATPPTSPAQVEAQEAIQMAQQALRGSAGKLGERESPSSQKGSSKRDYTAKALLSFQEGEARRQTRSQAAAEETEQNIKRRLRPRKPTTGSSRKY